MDCLVKVPPEAVTMLRDFMAEQYGPRSEHLSWYPSEFDAQAQHVYAWIGKPKISLASSWNVFKAMVNTWDNALLNYTTTV